MLRAVISIMAVVWTEAQSTRTGWRQPVRGLGSSEFTSSHAFNLLDQVDLFHESLPPPKKSIKNNLFPNLFLDDKKLKSSTKGAAKSKVAAVATKGKKMGKRKMTQQPTYLHSNRPTKSSVRSSMPPSSTPKKKKGDGGLPMSSPMSMNGLGPVDKGGKGKGSMSKGTGKGSNSNGKGKGSNGGGLQPSTVPSKSASSSPTAPGTSPSISPTKAGGLIPSSQSPSILANVPSSDNPTTVSTTQSPTGFPTVSVPSVMLSPFNLHYLFNQTSIPGTTDDAEVAQITDGFLNDYFSSQLPAIQHLQTMLVDSLFTLAQPYLMNYSAVAYFLQGTSPVPSRDQLDALVRDAFNGSNLDSYIQLLQALPESNPLSTTSSANLTETPQVPPSSVGSSSRAAIGASVGAGAFLFILAAIVIYRLWSGRDTGFENDMDKDGGHLTIAGGTYTGGSTLYAGSEIHLLQQSGLMDELQSEGSDWNASTLNPTEDGGSIFESERPETIIEEPSDDELPAPPMFEEEFVSLSQLHCFDEALDPELDEGNVSEDEEVPMRVVDLIKLFSVREKKP